MLNTPNNFTNLAGLTFSDVKYNFINYLKSQSEFTDYNLEGSNFTVLMDILAYNASQQGFYNTIVANEMFIDRASKRSSVISLSKLMGYTPNSITAAKAKILIVVDAENVPDSKILKRGTTFTGKNTDGDFSFVNLSSNTFYPYEFQETTDPAAEGNGAITKYACGPIELHQGALNTKSFNVSRYDESFFLRDKNIDRDSIKVYVTDSLTDVTGILNPWRVVTDITTLTDTSEIFFLEENGIEQFVIRFGDGVVGKKVKMGNIVIVEYLITAGPSANNIGMYDTTQKRSFSSDNNDYTVYTLAPSFGGKNKESTNSIRKNATVNYTSKNRAVTYKDYEGFISSAFNDNVVVRCWGGEENDPPYYGKVFLSLRQFGSSLLSKEEKDDIVNSILKTKNIVGMGIVIVDPEIINVLIDIDVYYDAAKENKSKLLGFVRDTARLFFKSNLIEFGDSFFGQDIEEYIRSKNSAIKNIETRIRIKKKFAPEFGITKNIVVDFQNAIYHPHDGHKSVVKSNNFALDSTNNSYCVEDDGYGNLVLYQKLPHTRVVINDKYGTIDYSTGKLNMPNFKVWKLFNNEQYFQITAVTANNSIFSNKNHVLEFDVLDNDALTINIKEVTTIAKTHSSSTSTY